MKKIIVNVDHGLACTRITIIDEGNHQRYYYQFDNPLKSLEDCSDENERGSFSMNDAIYWLEGSNLYRNPNKILSSDWDSIFACCTAAIYKWLKEEPDVTNEKQNIIVSLRLFTTANIPDKKGFWAHCDFGEVYFDVTKVFTSDDISEYSFTSSRAVIVRRHITDILVNLALEYYTGKKGIYNIPSCLNVFNIFVVVDEYVKAKLSFPQEFANSSFEEIETDEILRKLLAPFFQGTYNTELYIHHKEEYYRLMEFVNVQLYYLKTTGEVLCLRK